MLALLVRHLLLVLVMKVLHVRWEAVGHTLWVDELALRNHLHVEALRDQHLLRHDSLSEPSLHLLLLKGEVLLLGDDGPHPVGTLELVMWGRRHAVGHLHLLHVLILLLVHLVVLLELLKMVL
jgi:hypothetical protein